ncbi:MAG: endonuclease/exonuclease/phosphatase family protein [Verrucomicrobia bacterium]|nr:endonuclease/exonuclease/phosphatase family protein [Verrucomicrobiota bacterium]
MKTRGWLGVCGLLMLALRLSAETLTIATYNVENYVAADRMVDGTYRQAYPKPEAEKKALRAVIRALDADVIALQEMGSRIYLEELQRDLASEGLQYPHAELLDGADADRHVAVLSRRPFASVTKHAELTHSYFGKKELVKRGLIEVRFATEVGEVALFVVHLKSRFTDRPDDPNSALRRLGEATAVRDQVLKIFPEPATARFLLVGDCNDSAASKPLRALAQKGKTEIAEILPAADSHGEVWSHFYKKEQIYSRVDHVLVSTLLMSAVAGGSAKICDVAETAAASDHRPLVVTLKLVRNGGSSVSSE